MKTPNPMYQIKKSNNENGHSFKVGAPVDLIEMCEDGDIQVTGFDKDGKLIQQYVTINDLKKIA